MIPISGEVHEKGNLNNLNYSLVLQGSARHWNELSVNEFPEAPLFVRESIELRAGHDGCRCHSFILLLAEQLEVVEHAQHTRHKRDNEEHGQDEDHDGEEHLDTGLADRFFRT